MLEGLLHLISRRPMRDVVIDILDLVVVTYVVYRALLVLRGTRAMQMGTGLGVIFLVYVLAKWAGFVTLFNLLSTLLSSIILIVVVVFQNDIRRGLMRVGSQAFFGGMSRQQESKVIDEVVAAVTELARHRMGALVCFEQDANLDEFVVGQGTYIDASVKRELLVSLFVPEGVNKLHDGAVVIRNLRISKAGVFFPMPDTKVLDKSLGSRHRAALGITEETDAVVVVVSEERGTISFCFNGNIVSNLDGASLRQALLGLFGQRARKKKKLEGKGKGNTGTFRLSVPPPSPGITTTGTSLTSPGIGPNVAGITQTGITNLSGTGSVVLPPPARETREAREARELRESRDGVPLSERPPRVETRPMAPAKPIEGKAAGAPVSKVTPSTPPPPSEKSEKG
ncbi:MAG: diadenylate cyclase CdaA [Polyangiaceae bacterium]